MPGGCCCYVFYWKRIQSFIRVERLLVDTASAWSVGTVDSKQKIKKIPPAPCRGDFLLLLAVIFVHMRVVIQRVSQAAVSINNTTRSEIKTGLLVLVGIEDADTLDALRGMIAA